MSHFNSSLSRVQECSSSEIVKAEIKLQVTFTLTNGGYHASEWANEPIIIRRRDVEHVHDYARQNCSPRDYLFIRLPMKIGLRTGELCTLRIENIDFGDRTFFVLDSKKKELYPLPLDMLTLQLIQDLIQNRLEGYVFSHVSWKRKKKDRALTTGDVWHVVKKIAEDAGVPGFNPRVLRHYFAANWILVEKKSLVGLQRILRHKTLVTTSVYVSKLVFFEDLQKEYNGIQDEPIAEPETTLQKRSHYFSEGNVANPRSALVAGDSICNGCVNLEFCKFAPLPSCVLNCHFQKLKEVKM